jgi:hypothetical protein
MAKLPDSFKTVESNDELLEPGEYLAEIIKSDMKQTNAGDGYYIAYQFQVVDGPSKGKILFCNINIINPSPIAVKIAKGSNDKICKAVGKIPDAVTDTEELHKIPMIIVVTKRPDDDAYPGNDIKNFKKAGTTPPAAGAPKKNPFAKK